MTPLHYVATAKDSRTLELPAEAQSLNLQTGDEVHIFVNRNETAPLDSQSEEERQSRFRELTAQLYAQADATEREPITCADPQNALIAQLIAEKHRKMGMKV